ncbi:MAG TPA: 50S ribosomal protein L4 [Eubacteriaceae bacterium]|nr:50S ribosomal protein L4 [Eubacteriaceae bacterium]
MPSIDVMNMKGDKVEELSLKDEVFGIEPNESVVHEVVVAQLANRRQGTQSAKTRSEVRGGGRKPWRQKGTGRARAGTIRSPLWKGGGVVFAPKPRDYSKKVNKKVKRLAMKSVLSAKLIEQELVVLDAITIEKPQTKTVVELLKNVNADKKALVVTAKIDNNVYRSARNIPGVKAIAIENLNVYDVLKYDKLILTKEVVEKLEEVYV